MAAYRAHRSPRWSRRGLLRRRGALHPAAGTRLVAFRVYAGSLMAMLGFVAAAIGVSWADLELTSRLVFSGLFGLGLYMAWRAYRARARLRRQSRAGGRGTWMTWASP